MPDVRLGVNRYSSEQVKPTDSADPNNDVRVIVTARLDEDGRPVGFTQVADGRQQPFVGWLSLMSEMSRLLAEKEEN